MLVHEMSDLAEIECLRPSVVLPHLESNRLTPQRCHTLDFEHKKGVRKTERVFVGLGCLLMVIALVIQERIPCPAMR